MKTSIISKIEAQAPLSDEILGDGEENYIEFTEKNNVMFSSEVKVNPTDRAGEADLEALNNFFKKASDVDHD